MMNKILKYALLLLLFTGVLISILTAIGHICGWQTDANTWTEIIVYYIIFQLLLFWRHERKKQNH